MGIYLEALILYILLFFSGAMRALSGAQAAVPSDADTFPAMAELIRILAHNIPSLGLIWYLLIRAKRTVIPPGSPEWNLLPGRKDLISGVITFPCLLLTGFTIAAISSYIGRSTGQISLIPPSGGLQWLIICISCISSAYLEESFFRFYLLSRREELKLSAAQALVLSAVLFSICHIYEGPWGFLNSVISGIILCFVFLRYKALHGIAIAHGLYNISVYVIAALFS